MWIFKFIPDAFWYVLLVIGSIGSLLLQFFPNFAYTRLLKIVFGMLIPISFYFIGALHNNQVWVQKAHELELKVAELEVAATKTNVKIETKVVTKTQLVRERGQDVIQYVDREVVKYNNQCVIPPEFIQAHNKAAEAPK